MSARTLLMTSFALPFAAAWTRGSAGPRDFEMCRELEHIVLRESKPNLDLIEGGHLREGVDEQAAEACCHLVAYKSQVGEVGVESLLVLPAEGRDEG